MIKKRPLSAGGWHQSPVLEKCILEDEDNSFDYTSLLTKESKLLFSLIQEFSNIKSLQWPVECQFLDRHPQHIYYVPYIPEPFYAISGKEERPKSVSRTEGVVVYRNPVVTLDYFHHSTTTSCIFPSCPTSNEVSLKFESRFESGNLSKAVKINDTFYELYLRTDLYTSRHIQWYYFKVSHMQNKLIYRFSIVNLTKDYSLYKDGLRPLMYSTKDAQCRKVGWKRCGYNITYYCNKSSPLGEREQRNTYTLTFNIRFPYKNDIVYFAYSYPYTYSDLRNYLLKISKHPYKSKYATTRVLCQTLAGNDLYYVTITSDSSTDLKFKKQFYKDRPTEKKSIIITARVHPAETPSSWIMKGFIDFLTGTSNVAKYLRDRFIFKLIPMLNPDGVIVGNTRCSLKGNDLNRQYRNTIRQSYPTIWYTKLIIDRMIEKTGVAVYCDIHAHSKSHNIFLYGCENNMGFDKCLEEQIFASMLQKNASNKFCLNKCRYSVHQRKEGTARAVMGMMGVPISFTLEASVGGSRLGSKVGTHFTVKDYEEMAYSFCETLYDYYDTDPKKERIRKKIENRIRSDVKTELEKKKNAATDQEKLSKNDL